MLVLGFDTATPTTTVALLDEQQHTLLELHDNPAADARPGHMGALLTLLHQVLEQGHHGWAQVNRVAVGVGPGTFTGLRIGVATARALAQAHGIEAVGVCSLTALAAAVCDESHWRDAYKSFVAIINGGRGEVFVGAYDAAGTALQSPSVLNPTDAAELIRSLPGPQVIFGSGALKFQAQLVGGGVALLPPASTLHNVDARWICRLGLATDQTTQIPQGQLLPNYLREPDIHGNQSFI